MEGPVPLTKEAYDLINGATRVGTKRKYNSIVGKWTRYCQRFGYDLMASTNNFANFIAAEFTDRQLRYSYLRSYQSALKPYMGKVNMNTVRQLLKGIYNARPPVARHCATWDVNIVLNFLSAMRTDTLMLLSQKVTTLLMLLSGNRVNMLTHMKITQLYISKPADEITFTFDETLKHDHPGISTEKMTFRAYHEKSLCPVAAILVYLDRRRHLSQDEQFFIITRDPHHGAHHDSIARWIKDVLGAAGIDTGRYQAHSCRAASTSKAALSGVSLDTIIKSAMWSNVKTFRRFYQKEITTLYTEQIENFGVKVLEQYEKS